MTELIIYRELPRNLDCGSNQWSVKSNIIPGSSQWSVLGIQPGTSVKLTLSVKGQNSPPKPEGVSSMVLTLSA